MFGCYRKGDANDADTFVKAVSHVLSHYAAEVVRDVTDPFAGLPSRKKDNGYSGMPDVADVKEACEDEAARLYRMAEWKKIGKTEFKRLPAPKETRPGAWANVLVHAGHPEYEALKARAVLKGEDPRDWKIDDRGLHVSLTWLDGPGAERKQLFAQYTEADLRRMYPAREAATDSEMPHVKQSEAAE